MSTQHKYATAKRVKVKMAQKSFPVACYMCKQIHAVCTVSNHTSYNVLAPVIDVVTLCSWCFRSYALLSWPRFHRHFFAFVLLENRFLFLHFIQTSFIQRTLNWIEASVGLIGARECTCKYARCTRQTMIINHHLLFAAVCYTVKMLLVVWLFGRG